MAELRDYSFVDTKVLDSYVEQFSTLEVEVRSRAAKVALSITGPSADYTTSFRVRPKTTTEKINELVEHLSEQKLVGRTRPKLMSGYQAGRKEMPPFFLEKTTARKVILPTKLLEVTPGIRQLAVWISDPNPKLLVPQDAGWDFPGSFLYLTEAHLDGGVFQTVFSGCSALQAIANATDNRPLLDRSNSAGEPLGRGSHSHPVVDKLIALGGTVSDTRKIECLYRIRYMTNEQCFSNDGVEYRVRRHSWLSNLHLSNVRTLKCIQRAVR